MAGVSGQARQAQPAQVRPGPMVTAAATAVIIVSLAGLAMMTGVMPLPLTANHGAMPMPASGANPLTAYTSPLAPASVVTPPTEGQRQLLQAPDASLPGATFPAASAPAASSPAVPPVVPPTASSAESSALPNVSRHSLPAARRERLPHDGQSPNTAHRQRAHAYAAALPGTPRKTREQVIAELLEAKRNGTYPANSDLYR